MAQGKPGQPRATRTRGSTMLTPELHAQLCRAARRLRVFDAQVAIYCKISPDTLRNWLTWGLIPDAEEPYKSFAEEYSRIQIAQEAWGVRSVRKGMKGCDAQWRPGDWKSAAWYLERRFPKRWNPTFQPAGGPNEAFDIETLLRDAGERHASMVEVLRNAPPELVAAIREASDDVRAILDAEPIQEAATLKLNA